MFYKIKIASDKTILKIVSKIILHQFTFLQTVLKTNEQNKIKQK